MVFHVDSLSSVSPGDRPAPLPPSPDSPHEARGDPGGSDLRGSAAGVSSPLAAQHIEGPVQGRDLWGEGP